MGIAFVIVSKMNIEHRLPGIHHCVRIRLRERRIGRSVFQDKFNVRKVTILGTDRHAVDEDVLRCLAFGFDARLDELHIDGIGLGVQGDDRFLFGVMDIKHHTS